ncbi:MAG: hypothetical protein OEZ04_02570 [Nitrospinota bacterium]|nr:hypothetical protein [Nitrospinota bacterium]
MGNWFRLDSTRINRRLSGAAYGCSTIMNDRFAPLAATGGAATACCQKVITGGRLARRDGIDIPQAILFFKEPGVHASSPAPAQAMQPDGMKINKGAQFADLPGYGIAVDAFRITNSNHGGDYGSWRLGK